MTSPGKIFPLLGPTAFLLLVGCGKEDSLPKGKPLPPPPVFQDAVEKALEALPARKDPLGEKPGKDLEGAAQLAMMSDLRMAARGWRDLKDGWPRSAAALGPLLLSDRISGEKKARILDWAAAQGGPAAVALCRLALEGRPDQAVEPRRRAVVLLGEIGGSAEIPVLILRLKYEEYGDPYALAWAARSLARLGNLSGLPYLLALLDRRDLMEEAGRILVEILGWEKRPWKKGGTWKDLERETRALLEAWRKEGRSLRSGRGPTPPDLVRELLLRLKSCLRFNMRYQDDALFILSRSGRAALPALRAGLRDRHRNIRVVSVDAAGRLGPFARELCPLLVPLAGDRGAGLYAVEALGLLGCPGAGPYLVGLARGGNPDLRQAALLALGRVRYKKALPLLEAVLARPNPIPEERMAAALSLGLLGEKERALALLRSLRKDPQVHQPTLEAYLEELRTGRPPSR